MIENDDDNNV